MNLIEVYNLKKEFVYGKELRVCALNSVSFSVKEGEFLSIMGPSGSGKSTLLQILGLLDKPTSGKYLFNGVDTSKLSDVELARLRNKKIGFVFQNFYLLPKMTLLENVKLPLLYSDIPRRMHNEMARKVIDQVGLTHRIYHTQDRLSGGERQRVAIARALVTNPDLILADEPTGNLDSKSGKQVMDILYDLNTKQGKTIVLITHENYTAHYGEKILFLKDGRIEKEEAVKQRSKKEYFIK